MADEAQFKRRRDDGAQAEFRRRVAYYCLLALTLFGWNMITRDTDLGTNTTTALVWIIGGMVVGIVGAISSKALEAWAAIRTGQVPPK